MHRHGKINFSFAEWLPFREILSLQNFHTSKSLQKITASKSLNTYSSFALLLFISFKVIQRFQSWIPGLQTETQSASHSGPIPPESSSYLWGGQMSCLQLQSLERAPHPSHSVLWLFVWVCVCMHVCALLLKYTMRVCKSSAISTVVTYVKPRSFAPFLTYPSSSTSSSALCASAVSCPLPRPWHRPSTANCLP